MKKRYGNNTQKSLPARPAAAVGGRHEVRNRRFPVESADYRRSARRGRPYAARGGLRGAEYHRQGSSRNIRTGARSSVFRRVYRCGRRDRAGLRHSGRNPSFRLCVSGRDAGRDPADAVVEHAGGLRRADDRESAAGDRPGRGQVRQQGRRGRYGGDPHGRPADRNGT